MAEMRTRGAKESRRAPSLSLRLLTRMMIFCSILYWCLLLALWTSKSSQPDVRHRMFKGENGRYTAAEPVQLVRVGVGDHVAKLFPVLSDQASFAEKYDEEAALTQEALGSIQRDFTDNTHDHYDSDVMTGASPQHLNPAPEIVLPHSVSPEESKELVDADEQAQSVKSLPSGETRVRSLKCISWRNTGGCSLDGAREPQNDLACSDFVPTNASGYCEVEDTNSGERFRVMRRSCNILRRGVPFRCANAPSFAKFPVQAHAAIQIALSPNFTMAHANATAVKPRDGIVMVVYPKLIPSAFATIRALRDILGCTLPIEIWYRPDEMKDDPEALAPLQHLAQKYSTGDISFHKIASPVAKRFVTKIYAIYRSFFDRVLFLDADNVPVRDPRFLFESLEFNETGAIFWPDFWHPTSTMFGLHSKSLLWELLDIPFVDMFEQESGQLVIDRRRHAAPLALVVFYALHEPNFLVHYKLAWGDKDLFRLAWLKLNATFHMIKTPPAMAGMKTQSSAFCGMTMVQHDASGDVLFLHRNKHKLTGSFRLDLDATAEVQEVQAPPAAPLVPDQNIRSRHADPAVWTHLLSFRSNWSRNDYVVERFIASLDFTDRQKCFGRRNLGNSPQFQLQEFAELSYAGLEDKLRDFAMEATKLKATKVQ